VNRTYRILGKVRQAPAEIPPTSAPSRSALFFCSVIGVTLGDLCSVFVTWVNKYTVPQGQAAARRNCSVTRAGFGGSRLEVVPAERIGGEESIIAGMPPSRVAEVLRVIERKPPKSLEWVGG
jgi:hypothetical protein